MQIRTSLAGLVLTTTLISCGQGPRHSLTLPGASRQEGTQLRAQGQLSIKNADPSVIRVGSNYVSAESVNNSKIYVRTASSLDGLASATPQLVFSNPGNWAEVWAPEVVLDYGVYYIYFTAGSGSAHRMYWIKSSNATSGYTSPQQLALPDNKWAIDGTSFFFNSQRWFVWSGWAGDTNGEQNLYIARMPSAESVTGARYIISQPRESWEQADLNPPTRVNEGPEAIKDPNGQLHIVYSANGSWDINYCLADLRLRPGGDPTYVWDWWKSNGCLFGANRNIMMSGWDPTLYTKGVGHNSFALLYGDISYSPASGPTFPMMYHGVPKNDYPNPFWSGRYWYSGSAVWWGSTTYRRGADSNTGWSLKFFE